MRVRVGTSGFAYKEWKGSFYPEDLAAEGMLRFYASRFPTVEINNTFYRMPTEGVLARWSGDVPAGFRFVLKAPQRITHQKKLQGVGEDVAHLLRVASVLGDKLGPMLFQLPPFFKKDLTRLRDFFAGIPGGSRVALEFRHASWFDDEVYEALGAHDAALCAADVDGEEQAPFVRTASWGYLRLRREHYGEGALAAWAERVKGQAWGEAYAFFKHEEAGTGPKLAAEFSAILEGGG